MEGDVLPPKSDEFEALIDFVTTGTKAESECVQVEIYGDYFPGDRSQPFDENVSGIGRKSFPVTYMDSNEELLNDPSKCELPYTCSFCDAVSFGLRSFEDHLEIHRGGAKHRCEICGITFQTEAYLAKHMQTHCYRCVFCDQIFEEQNLFLQHVHEHTRENIPVETQEKKKSRKKEGAKHKMKSHKRAHGGGKIFQCTRCDIEFPRKYHLSKHMELHKKQDKELWGKSRMKTKNPAKALRLEDIIKNVRTQNRDRNNTCQTCGEAFVRKEELQRHELLHSTTEPFICSVCSKPFAKKNYLKIHMQVHAKREMYKCAPKENTDFSRVLTPERSYKNRVCEREFWLKEDTFQHSRLPVKHRPFKCISCEKSFSRRSDLNRHEKAHTNEKLYHCQFCNKAFNRKDNLATHMRIYTQERPHKCGICEKAFTRKADMQQHMNTHKKEKPFVCDLPDCTKTFTRKSDLSRHKRQVHKIEMMQNIC